MRELTASVDGLNLEVVSILLHSLLSTKVARFHTSSDLWLVDLAESSLLFFYRIYLG